MNKKSKKDKDEKTTMLEGVMTFGKTGNGQNMLDFMCTEYAEISPFIGDCRVQAMRDGNVYITEKPKRVRGKALFREDNCSLTLGRDGKYHFVFTMEKGQVRRLPEQLVHQSLAIAQKVERVILKKKEVRK